MLAHGAVKDLEGTQCGNTYTTRGRGGYQAGVPCPGKLVRTQPREGNEVDFKRFYRWDGCECMDNRRTNNYVSVRKDSFFEGSHVPSHVLLLFVLLWISGAKHTLIRTLTGMSNRIVTAWIKKILAAIQWDVLHHPDGQKIGGEGVAVAVDESKVVSTVAIFC